MADMFTRRDAAACGTADLAWLILTGSLTEDRADENQLKHYWTKTPEGLAKWADSPHPWTSLHRHLEKYLGPERAKRVASEWFHDVFHFWPGSDLNRVTHGKPPRGKKIGPG